MSSTNFLPIRNSLQDKKSQPSPAIGPASVELINKRKYPHTGFDSYGLGRNGSNHSSGRQSSPRQPMPGSFLADTYEFDFDNTPTFSFCHNPDVSGWVDLSTGVPEPRAQGPRFLTKTNAVGEAFRQVASAVINFPGSAYFGSQPCMENDDLSAGPAQMPRGASYYSHLNSFLGNGINDAAAARVNFGEAALSSGRGAKTQSNENSLNDPRKMNQEIKQLLENIQPDVELQPEEREETPGGLRAPLVSHSLLA